MDAALAGDYATAAAYGERFLARARTEDAYARTAFQDELQLWRAFRREAGDHSELGRLAAAAPLPLHANRSARPEVILTVGGQPALALLDTGAEQSVISHDLAKRLGLALLPGVISDTGAAGAKTVAQVALLPKLQLGGVSLRDAPVEVLDDGVEGRFRPAAP